MKYINYLTILIVMCFSCNNIDHPYSNKTQIVHSILNKVGQNFKDKYDLEISGFTLSGGKKGYDTIGIDFDKRGILSKNEGRKIIVECLNDLLNEINSNSELQPYLFLRPFSIKNIRVTILILDADGKLIYYPSIEIIGARNGHISYLAKSMEDEYKFVSLGKETFEEAVKIVESQI